MLSWFEETLFYLKLSQHESSDLIVVLIDTSGRNKSDY